MKKLTHEEIKALPKDTKVLVELEVRDVEDTSPMHLIGNGNFSGWFYEDSPIYLPTPELQPLTDEMPKEFAVMVGGMGNAKYLWAYVRENYGTQPREWWMDLKPGDKIRYKENILVVSGIKYLGTVKYGAIPVDDCRPYTEPSPADKLKASLTEEQKELLKQINNLEELK